MANDVICEQHALEAELLAGNRERNQTRFYTCFALALFATMGVAFAANLFTLFLFYEVLTLSTYPLVAHKGDEATVRSARVYLGLLLATSIGLNDYGVIDYTTPPGLIDIVLGNAQASPSVLDHLMEAGVPRAFYYCSWNPMIPAN